MSKSEYAWRDQSTVVAGREVGTIQAIEYTTQRAQEYVYGAGDQPHSIQPGNKGYPVRITLLQSDIEALNQSAQALGAQDLTDIKFDVINSYAKSVTDARVTDMILGIAVEELPKGWNQGDPKMSIQLSGKALRIDYNV